MFKNYLIALKTLAFKECYRILRIWTQTIVPPVITMILYFLIFGQFLGNHIGMIEGVTYTSFITPGFIMMSTITNTYANVSGSLFMNKFQRSIEDLLIAPVPPTVILWGYILGGLFRGLLIALIVTLVACFFTKLQFTHYLILICTIFLTLIALSCAGFINGMIARKFDDIALVPTFILVPLTYLGGVFYPINNLAPLYYHISLFNPIIYMVNLFRYGMLGITDVNINFALSILLVITIALYLLAYWMFKQGIGVKR
ncbi:MAG: ABC transporter permease [Gammaproteobacteria bacterium RIFCSPHIGHO2_12_FULL_35_23]|nr:MAG: ABC transporter permease [Gammaproteobacteria bacterium RIFCSPHIGHO2_12_FULL_35_23]